MRKLELKVGKKSFCVDIPENWDELNAEQLGAIADITFSKDSDSLDFIRRYFNIPLYVVNRLDVVQLYTLNSLMGFIREPKAMNHFIVKTIRLNACGTDSGYIDVTAPDDKLAGVSFGRFMLIDTYYNWYMATRKREYAVMLFDAIYKDVPGHIQLDKAPYVNAALLQWSMIRLWLADTYKFLFPEDEDDKPKPKTAAPVISNTWIEIFDTLVEDDLTRIKSYKELPCMDVLRVINRRIRDNRFKK